MHHRLQKPRAVLVAALAAASVSPFFGSASVSNAATATDPVFVTLPQQKAFDFWRSMNVNTHFSFATADYDAQAARQVVNLGVAGVRDKLAVNAKGHPGSAAQVEAFQTLQSAGIKVHSTVGSLGDNRERVSAIVDAARELGGAKMFRSLGGVNEPNKNHELGWAEATVAHQRYIWEATADLRQAGVEIVGPSLYDQGDSPEVDFSALQALGISRYVTHGDFHRYPKGGPPTNGLQDRMDWTALAFDGKPTYATETGYNTGVHITDRGNPVSETVQATYTPRLFAEFFRAGVKSTFVYALLDDMSRSDEWQRYWGQIRADGTPKPSYQALSYLAHLVKGAAPNADTTLLNAAIELGDAPMRYLVLDHGGKHFILVWRNVTATDTSTAKFKISFPKAVTATVHRPTTQTSSTRASRRSHSVTVDQNLIVVQLP